MRVRPQRPAGLYGPSRERAARWACNSDQQDAYAGRKWLRRFNAPARVTEADARRRGKPRRWGVPPSPTAAITTRPQGGAITEWYKGKTHLPVWRQILSEICRCLKALSAFPTMVTVVSDSQFERPRNCLRLFTSVGPVDAAGAAAICWF
jgi:hypothetical protein